MKQMRDVILDFLNDRCGTVAPASLYDAVDVARDWWRGRYEPFHVFTEARHGGGVIRREMYKMGMAKKICEDWAAVLVNDRTTVRTDCGEIDRVLFGDRYGIGGILTQGNFYGKLNALTEQVFALGTGAVTAHFFGAAYDAQKNLIRASGIGFNFLLADQIFPLQCENGEIVSCAFVGSDTRFSVSAGVGEERLPSVFVTLHRKEYAGDGSFRYRVDNYLLRADGKEMPLPEDIVSYFYVPRPLFSILKPNFVPTDPICVQWGMGESIFASAYDNLRGVDLAYNNFCRDLYLGGKKVFMNQSLVRDDGYGRRVAPDDVAQQLFVTVGDGDLSSDTMIVEHNPQLRAEENCMAVQAQLDYLSFKVGFGTRHYRFSGDKVVTATQYAGEKQEMLQYAMKHYLHMENFLRMLVELSYWFAVVLCEQALPSLGTVCVDFDDSFFVDPTAERARDLSEVHAGLMAPWEYRVRYYGEHPDTAKAMIAEIGHPGT
ncbi:MAG: hypothetical protein IJC98_05415 [Clostridia bacterium]|nr:hypothetical protein [Clostridia bacterium]